MTVRLNVQPPVKRCSCRDSKSLALRTRSLFSCRLGIDRHASFQARPSAASAAAPPHAASAAARTKTVLRDVSGIGQRSVTDTSLSHCIVFHHMMLLLRFVLGSFCVSIAVL